MALFDQQPMGPIPARRPMNGIVVAVIGCAHLIFRRVAGRR